jgi:hypothetical protein
MHHAGQTAQAMERLFECAKVAPLGLWRGYAGIDAAWLCLESEDLARAQHLVRDLKPWLEEHPAGIVLDARLQYAQRAFKMAAELQRLHMTTIGGEAPAYYRELLEIYDRAAGGSPAPGESLPRTPWLITQM